MRQDLWTDGLWGGFAQFCERATKQLLVISPFITRRALEALLHGVTIRNVTVITTWKTADVLRGAADPGIYPYLRSRGWRLMLRPGLHAKLLVGDWRTAIISTANITETGLGMRQPPNLECALPIGCVSERDQRWLFAMLSESVLVTDDYYAAFTGHVFSIPRTISVPVPDFEPPAVSPNMKQLSLSDFPASRSPEELLCNLTVIRRGAAGELDAASLERTLHDATLLSLHIEASDEESAEVLREKFFVLPSIRKLQEFMRTPRFFGEIKSWLRNHCKGRQPALIDLTQCTQALFSWFSGLEQPRYLLTRPRYSQCLVPCGSEQLARGAIAQNEPTRRFRPRSLWGSGGSGEPILQK